MLFFLRAKSFHATCLCRAPDFDMSELEILFSAAAPASSVSAAEKAAKKAPPKQEKVHLVCVVLCLWAGSEYCNLDETIIVIVAQPGKFLIILYFAG